MHTVILGAGISGLVAAYTLSQHSQENYSVYDENSSIGGLCRMQEKDGFRIEFVSHVLHFRSEEAKQLVGTLLDGNLLRIERNASIYFRKRYVPYPFQTHLGFLPLAEKVSCLTSYWRARISRELNNARPAKNFEDWVRQNFGAGVSRYFMVPYNTKLWGLPPSEMSPDWIKSFVPPMSLRQAIAGALKKRTNHAGYNAILYYPERGGIESLVKALGARASSTFLNKRATEINLERKTVRFLDGQTVRYDRLISTIPLKTLALQAVGVPEGLRHAAAELRCTSLLNITYCVRRPLPLREHWVYFPEPQFPFFRLVFPSNVCPSLAPENNSIISAEVSNPEGERQEETVHRVKELLVELGLIHHRSDIVFTVCNYLTHAYPIHDLGREIRVASLLEFLKSRDVWSIGRFGAWRYSSIDDAIVAALSAAGEIHQSSSLVRPEFTA